MRAWGDRVAEAQIEGALIKALGSGVVTESDRAVVFHDMCLLRDRLQHLQSEFPPRTLHAVAIKANPIVAILHALAEQGAGLEAASLEETALALAAGCPPERIVFDSPAKTVAELHEALRLGFVLNVDNFAELARIDEILATSSTASLIGLRVNPMVGAGSIGITSVADGGSKFGVRIDIERDAIFEAFARYDWLRGLHMHVGSQGCDLDLFVRAASVIEDLYTEITRRFGAERVAFVDIGGGLPVEYTAADKPPSLTEFLAAMSAAVPSLFDGKVRLITEFGRAVHSGCGFAASRVEYVKGFADHELAVIHLGADMFMRPVYLPEQWKHRFLVCDCHGRIKRGARKRYTIGGPLCFAGDLVARDLELPAIEPGDFVVVRDVGAYTVSMWSRHCSRGLPKVVGFDADRDNALQVLLRPETPADVVQFWGGAEL